MTRMSPRKSSPEHHRKQASAGNRYEQINKTHHPPNKNAQTQNTSINKELHLQLTPLRREEYGLSTKSMDTTMQRPYLESYQPNTRSTPEETNSHGHMNTNVSLLDMSVENFGNLLDKQEMTNQQDQHTRLQVSMTQKARTIQPGASARANRQKPWTIGVNETARNRPRHKGTPKTQSHIPKQE